MPDRAPGRIGFFGTTTTAVEQGGGFILNGQKRFIVGAEGADYFLVYALSAPEAATHQAMTCFIVDREPRVETEYRYRLMGCRGGGAARLVFKDVRVPRENIVGRLHGAYDVFNTMMVPERLGAAAMTIGAAQPALEIATGYTARRKAFGRTINQFQGVSFQDFIADPLLQQVCSWAVLLGARGQPFTSTRPQVHMAPRTSLLAKPVAIGKILLGSLRQ
jgi:hypothetical protein